MFFVLSDSRLSRTLPLASSVFLCSHRAEVKQIVVLHRIRSSFSLSVALSVSQAGSQSAASHVSTADYSHRRDSAQERRQRRRAEALAESRGHLVEGCEHRALSAFVSNFLFAPQVVRCWLPLWHVRAVVTLFTPPRACVCLSLTNRA